MSKPLFFKELRETWWMGLAAGLVVLCVVINETGVSFSVDGRIRWVVPLRYSPFQGRDFPMVIGTITLLAAAALGLWQSLAESITGTWSYLLHRPISRRQVVVTKLLAGTLVLLAGIGVPLFAYLLWALCGTHGTPFELWMTYDTLRFCMTGALAYPAAFLCGIRPARIYASRLWPAVPVILIFAAQLELSALPTIGWQLILVGAVLLIPSILFAAVNRDYA